MLNEYIHLCLPTPTSQLHCGNNCGGNISLWFFMIPKRLISNWSVCGGNSDWVKTMPVFLFALFFLWAEEWRFYDYINGAEQVTWRQKQAWALLRFPNSPLALKVSTALSWRESEDVASGVMQWQRCGCIYTWEKLFRESLHSPEVWPPWGCDGVFYKALVLNLRAQFKCITPPERPFYVVSQGQTLAI